MTVWEWFSLVILIPGLITLNGFFVAVEFALIASRKTKMESLAEKGDSRAIQAFALQKNLDQAVASTQLGITFASISLGSVGEVTMASILHRALDPLIQDLVGQLALHSFCSTVAVIAVSFMHLIFGELIPKTIAIQSPDRIVLLLASPMHWFLILSRPIVWGMNAFGSMLLKAVGFKNPGNHAHAHSVEELLMIVEDTEEAGFIVPEQADVLENVFRLSSKTVADCMIPASKINALELNSPPDSILEDLRNRAHTRLPVYEGTLDNIVGVVNVKDLLFLFTLHGLVILEDALYPPVFIDPGEQAINALKLFRRNRRHMAIVRDASKRTLGILTLEDVLEEIVGQIFDEHDVGSAFQQGAEIVGQDNHGTSPEPRKD